MLDFIDNYDVTESNKEVLRQLMVTGIFNAHMMVTQ